jgi:hypothetical protein
LSDARSWSREYGLSLGQRLSSASEAATQQCVAHRDSGDDREKVVAILCEPRDAIPVWMGTGVYLYDHAANLGTEIIRACAELGARDYQHAARAVLREKSVRALAA